MTSLNKADADLHYPDGEHRTTAPSANGRVVDLYERRIRRHLEAHRLAPGHAQFDSPSHTHDPDGTHR